MPHFQLVMIICATAMLVITLALFVISRVPLRSGPKWWAAGSFLQFVSCLPSYFFFEQEQTDIGLVVMFTLFMGLNFSISFGILQFIGTKVSLPKRLVTLTISILAMVTFVFSKQALPAALVSSFYCAFVAFESTYRIWTLEKPDILLKASGVIYFLMGIHFLDFPILSKVEWFVPIGFMLNLVLFLSLFGCLGAIALMQFAKAIKDSEEKAIQSSIHDPLTGLFNRSHLKTLFANYESDTKRTNSSFLLLYIDLDGFKSINDTHGHHAGDVVLTVISKRLQSWLGKKGDAIRIGGDELVVLNRLRSGGDPDNDIVYGTSAAHSILELIEKPIVDGTETYSVSASIGCCYHTEEYRDLDAMLSKADELMYFVKKKGGKDINFENYPDGSRGSIKEARRQSAGADSSVSPSTSPAR